MRHVRQAGRRNRNRRLLGLVDVVTLLTMEEDYAVLVIERSDYSTISQLGSRGARIRELRGFV